MLAAGEAHFFLPPSLRGPEEEEGGKEESGEKFPPYLPLLHLLPWCVEGRYGTFPHHLAVSLHPSAGERRKSEGKRKVERSSLHFSTSSTSLIFLKPTLNSTLLIVSHYYYLLLFTNALLIHNV